MMAEEEYTLLIHDNNTPGLRELAIYLTEDIF